ncbi:MAG: pyridoxal-dependent decarboxylase [Ilumatobacteraceae bacterium]
MITPDGLGYEQAFALFRDVLAPACISSDHPRYLAFVPTAPSEAATLFDLVVSASSIYGDWWVEGAGAIFAENATLRWLADLAGFPEGAGGVFVSGGTAGNLAALTTARETWRRRHGAASGWRWLAPSAHSSIRLAAMVTDVEMVTVPGDNRGRLTGPALRNACAAAAADGITVFAVVATGGATNTGIVDDLAGAAEVAGEMGVAARGRRLRRGGDGVHHGPPAVRRRGARRLLRGRPPQVAVLAVRLRGHRLPGAEAGRRRTHPARRVPGDAGRHGRVEPERLRHPHDPPRPRATAVVQRRRPRHPRLRPGGHPQAGTGTGRRG